MNVVNPSPKKPRGFADILGVFLSQLCLAHCFLLPLVLALLSVDLHSVPGGEALHFGVLLLSTPTAFYALSAGRRFHGRERPIILGALGLVFLWVGSTLDLAHLWLPHSLAHSLGALGSLLLIGAHLDNRHQSKNLSPCAYHQHYHQASSPHSPH